MPYSINLADHNKDKIRVYAGRKYGERVRQAADLNQLDSLGQVVEIIFPADTFSINSSFFLGMFGESIRRLGDAGFRAQYHFTGPGVELVLEDAIREALNTTSPFAAAAQGSGQSKHR